MRASTQKVELPIFLFYFILFLNFTILYWFCHISKWIHHRHTRVWCFWTAVLEKTLESPLDCKEIQPVHPKGDHSWVFIGRTNVEAETPLLWPPGANSWLIWRPWCWKDWGQEKKGMREHKMVRWHHRLNGHGFEQAPWVGDGQGGLLSCSPWGFKESDMTEWLNWTELIW